MQPRFLVGSVLAFVHLLIVLPFFLYRFSQTSSIGLEMAVPMLIDFPFSLIYAFVMSVIEHSLPAKSHPSQLAGYSFMALGTFQWYWIGSHWENIVDFAERVFTRRKP